MLEELNSHVDSVYSVSFSPNGRSIVSGSLDKTIKMWDLSLNTLNYLEITKKVENPMFTTVKQYKSTQTFVGHRDFVLSVGYAGTNALFAKINEAGEPVDLTGEDQSKLINWVVSCSKDW